MNNDWIFQDKIITNGGVKYSTTDSDDGKDAKPHGKIKKLL